MKRLYQWFTERASFSASDAVANRMSRTVQTEVTVQREAMTLLVGEGLPGFNICPLCGQKVAPTHVGLASSHLQKVSTAPEVGSVIAPMPKIQRS